MTARRDPEENDSLYRCHTKRCREYGRLKSFPMTHVEYRRLYGDFVRCRACGAIMPRVDRAALPRASREVER